MKTVAGHRLQDAARMLNVGPRTLIQELRARGILDQHNLPYRHHVESGDFTISQRQHTLRGYHITGHKTGRKQSAWLTANNIRHWINAQNKVRVTDTAIDAAINPAIPQTGNQPNFAALRKTA